jgi:hypothetical protein
MQDDAGYNVATFAVLTGDIVASTGLSPARLDAAMETLATATREISGWRPGLVAGFGTARWRRVAMRGLRARPRPARGALFHRCPAPGGGRPVHAHRDRHGAGRAAGRCGHQSRPRSGLRRLGAPVGGDRRTRPHGPRQRGALGAATRLADHVAQGWTPAQARAMCEMLPPGAGPRAAAAERLGITRQAVEPGSVVGRVSRARRGAGHDRGDGGRGIVTSGSASRRKA